MSAFTCIRPPPIHRHKTGGASFHDRMNVSPPVTLETLPHLSHRSGKPRWVLVLLMVCSTAWSNPHAVGQVTVVNDAAHQQFVLAYRLLQRQQFTDAMDAFDTYLGSFPDDARRNDALYYRALLATRTGDLANAAECLAHTGDTTVVPAHAVALLAGQVHMARGQPDAALQALEPIDTATLAPETRGPLLHLRAVAYQKAGNLPAAAAQLEATADLDGALQARAAHDLGRVRAAMGDHDAALAALDIAAAASDPAISPSAALLAGNLRYASGAYHRALQDYALVLHRYQSAPAYEKAVTGAMWAALSAEQYEQVQALYQRHGPTLRNVERQAEAILVTATAWQRLNRHEAALTALDRAATLAVGRDTHQRILLGRVTSLLVLKRFPDAERVTNQLARQSPTGPTRVDVALRWAEADEARGRVDAALTRLSTLIDHGDTQIGHAAALRARAGLLRRAGRDAAAIADYETLSAGQSCCDDDAVTVQLDLVDLYLRSGRFDAALARLEALASGHRTAQITLPPTVDQEVLYRTAIALIRQQRFAPALAALTRLVEQHPQSPRTPAALHYRGLVRMTTDPGDEAVADLRVSGAMDMLEPPLRINGWRMVALHCRRQGREDEAMTALQELESLGGRDALDAEEAHWVAARYLKSGRPDTALGYLQPLLVDDAVYAPESRAGWLFLAGRCHQVAGNPAAALPCFEQVVALSSGHQWQALLEFGHTLRAMHRDQEAVNAYNVLAANPATRLAVEGLIGRAAAHVGIARASFAASAPDDAVEALLEARRDLIRIVVLHAHPSISPLPELAHIALHDVLLALDAARVEGMSPRDNLNELAQRYPGTPFAVYAQALTAEIDDHPAAALQLLGQITVVAVEDPRFATHVKAARQRLAHHR